MRWWMLCWLLGFMLGLTCVPGQAPCEKECQINNGTKCANCCLTCVDAIFKNGSLGDVIDAMKNLENVPEDEEMNWTELLLETPPTSPTPSTTPSITVMALPELLLGDYPDDSPGGYPDGSPHVSADGSTGGFADGSPDESPDGFANGSADGSLHVSPHGSPGGSPHGSPDSVSSTDEKILTYISLVGCSLSLFALVISVLLFIINRKLREDVSMKVHVNLVIALILLNLHFLVGQAVAAGSSTGLCLYMALALHYSLLATFSWMALEGFNLYLLVVKVFDIHISRYLLKLSVVGWGVPAVIVSVVVIINRRFYGLVSNSNGPAGCYITNKTVKMVTTLGLFSMVFLFNIIVFAVTVKRVFSVGHRNEIDRKRVGQHICRLLGVVALLGITWGLAFFSFGRLTTPGFYVFSILNSLQGFFIFLWFVMSLRKIKNSAPKTSTDKSGSNS